MDIQTFVDKCVAALDDMKAKDISVIDLQGKTSVSDYFVVATANNDRHATAMVNALVDETKALKRKAVHKDGEGRSGWMVLDFSDVVVHVFLPHVRERYDLESLWTIEFNKSQAGNDE